MHWKICHFWMALDGQQDVPIKPDVFCMFRNIAKTLERCVKVVKALLTLILLKWTYSHRCLKLSWLNLAAFVTHSGSSRDSFWQLSWLILAALVTHFDSSPDSVWQLSRLISGSARISNLAALVTHSGSSVIHLVPFKSDLFSSAFRLGLNLLKSVGTYSVLLSTMLVLIYEQITL